MKHVGVILGLIVLAALAAWIGPRPVHEPWTIETIQTSETNGSERALGLGLEAALARGESWTSERLAERLGERLGVPPSSIPEGLMGAVPLDADLDGDEDAFAWSTRSPGGGSRLVFLLNDGGVRDVARLLGPALRRSLAVVAAAAADLDGDRLPEIAIRLEDGSLAVLWNRLSPRPARAGDQ